MNTTFFRLVYQTKTTTPIGKEPRNLDPYQEDEVDQGPNVHCRLSPSVMRNATVCLLLSVLVGMESVAVAVAVVEGAT